jgi:chemotaxis protein CheD
MASAPSSFAPLPALTHTLHPGDVACGERGDTLETLLGSCVAIVLTDPRRTLGAMCHVVHSSQAPASALNSTAYAEPALSAMYRLLQGRGIVPSLCEAYVYGGGNMFPDLVGDRHVGSSNARWALNALARDRIRVIHHDLGGCGYRRVSWTIGPGAPVVRTVPVQS